MNSWKIYVFSFKVWPMFLSLLLKELLYIVVVVVPKTDVCNLDLVRILQPQFNFKGDSLFKMWFCNI